MYAGVLLILGLRPGTGESFNKQYLLNQTDLQVPPLIQPQATEPGHIQDDYIHIVTASLRLY